MSEVQVHMTADAAEALGAAGVFLRARPVDHNVALTILHERIAHSEPGRYWWVTSYEEVIGYAFQSPTTFSAGLTVMTRNALDPLVDRMAGDAPHLPGAIGEAGTAAAFAGNWAERLTTPAVPVEGQRIYRLDELVMPPLPPGHFRQAEPSERDLYRSWAEGFMADTGSSLDVRDGLDRRLTAGRLWVWDDDGPVSMAAMSEEVEGVARVGPVYTPPDRRGRGYAAACVARLSASVVESGARDCILYTQLANTTSNALYRRMGYEPASEVVAYRFG